MDLNVVILNWNARADTLDCLRRLRSWSRIEPRLYVVDNGSEPDESAALAAAVPGAEVLRSERNLGFSGGTNLGLRRALEDSGAPVLLLNNDAAMSEESAEALLRTLEADRRCAVVGPVIVSAREPARIQSAGSRGLLLRREAAIKEPPPEGEVYPVDFVSGAAAVIRASALREVGLLHEPYFFALELADFCRRVRDRGYRCLVHAGCRVEHDVDRASTLRATLYVYYVVRNRMLYARRFLPLIWLLPVAAWSLYGLQQALRLWLKKRQRGTAAAIFLGVGDGLRGRFGGQNDRVLRFCAAHPDRAAAS